MMTTMLIILLLYAKINEVRFYISISEQASVLHLG